VRPSLRKRLPQVERPGLQVVRPQETSLDGDLTMLQPYKFRCQVQRYLTKMPPLISSLPPDCTRAATVTVSERSEDLHVIAVLLTPQHHCIYPAAYISAIHTSPPRTIAQEASSLVGPRSRGSNLFTSHRAHALG
jgi:hypothetical protein